VECSRNCLLFSFRCLSAMGIERRSGRHRRGLKGRSADRDGSVKTWYGGGGVDDGRRIWCGCFVFVVALVGTGLGGEGCLDSRGTA